jgi:nicotinamidase-related amidase
MNRFRLRRLTRIAAAFALLSQAPAELQNVDTSGGVRIQDNAQSTETPYANTLTRLENPPPLLNDHPEYVAPVIEEARYEAPTLVNDPNANLAVRAWRFSYNARGIIEMPNNLNAKETAIIVVHPWAIDDHQGWRTPQPAGVADFCTPIKNHLSHEHIKEVLNPFLKSMRDKVGMVVYSQRADEKPVLAKIYRTIRKTPTAEEREEGKTELAEILNAFDYNAGALPETIDLTGEGSIVSNYFQHFPGLDAGDHYNGPGFWDLPVPVVDAIEVDPNDVVHYDADGYPAIRDFLKAHGIRHILLTGYATDMCYKSTTCGYENFSKDFNVFLVGDATLATFPANSSPAFATNAAISFASLNQLITQVSWIVPSE